MMVFSEMNVKILSLISGFWNISELHLQLKLLTKYAYWFTATLPHAIPAM